jgi:hypothetical protein
LADYRTEFSMVARTAFAMWNREPASPTYGSFDRPYWGWLFKDFGDATLQYAARIAVEHAKRRNLTANLPPLLAGFAGYCRRIQHRDGSFDQCYPHERTPGVIYDVLSTLTYVRDSPFLQSAQAKADLDHTIGAALRFCLGTDERHGEVANHLAEYSYELLHFAARSGDSAAQRLGVAYLDRTLALFNREEGWFLEYNGADAGYQTRCLRYLVKIATLTGREDLWAIAERAAGFIEQLLMPDHSVHPMLGVRSTALLYPSGIEVLAARNVRFAPLAARVRCAWESGAVPLPSGLDFANAIRLADDALDADDARAGSPAAAEPALPEGDVDFPAAGISIRRRADMTVYVAHRLGGSVVAYGRDARGQWSLCGEDSGYLLKTDGGSIGWTSRLPGSGTLVGSSSNRFEIRARFGKVLHEELTPFKLVLLRLLNFTVLRVQWLADIFRQLVVRRLMTGEHDIGITLEREIVLESAIVSVRDRIVPQSVPGPQGLLLRCRRLVGNHMASSRYFQENELIATPLGWADAIEWSGDTVEHAVEFHPPGR